MSRRWIVFGLRAAFTVSVLAALVLWVRADALIETMRRTGLGLWFLLVVTHILAHIGVAIKWRFLLGNAGIEVGFVDAIRAHGAGVFANTCLPSIIGGDVVRAGIVTRDKSRLPAVITGGVADRLTDFTSLIILAGVGLLLMPVGQSGPGVRILAVAGAALVLSVGGGVALVRFANIERLPERCRRFLSGLQAPIETMSERPGASVMALLVALMIQGFFVVQNILIGNAIGIDVSAAVWFAVWPLAKLAAFLPISLGGLGVREGVMTALLLPFSVLPALSVGASLVWQTVMYSLGIFGGIAAFTIGRFRPSLEAGPPVDVTCELADPGQTLYE